MLLVIHNLPGNIKYAEIKQLLQSKCGLNEVILDNLISEGHTKRVTVGLADDEDAAILVRKINGLFLGGLQLYVEDVRLKKDSEQPFRSSKPLVENPVQDDYNPYQDNKYQKTFQTNQQNSFQTNQPFQEPNPLYHNETVNTANAMGTMNYNMPMSNIFNMPQLHLPQTHFPGFGVQQQVPPLLPLPEVLGQASSSFGFNRERVEPNENRPRNWEEDQHQADDRFSRERPYTESGRAMSPNRGRTSDDFGRRTDRPVEPQNLSPWNAGELRDQFNKREVDNGMRDSQRDRSNLHQRQFDRFETSSSNFDSQTLISTSDAFGTHGASRWDVRSNSTSRDGNQASRQSRPVGNWRDEPREPAKRIRGKWENDEPQQKRFAPSRAPKMERFSDNKNFRDSGPQNQHYPGLSTAPQNNPWMGTENNKNSFSNSANIKKESVSHGRPVSNAPKATGRNKIVNSRRPNTIPVQWGGAKKSAASKKKKPYNQSIPNMEQQMKKDDTWRGQAAAEIAREIIKNLQYAENNIPFVLTQLKKSLRLRINMLMEDAINVTYPDIVIKYRKKYPSSSDKELFEAVLETVAKDKASHDEHKINALTGEKVIPSADQQKSENVLPPANANPPKSGQGKTNQPIKPQELASILLASRPTSVPIGPNTLKTIPKYPNGDKKLYNRLKELEKLELSGGDVYELPPELKKALDQDSDTLCDLFMGECMEPADEHEKIICEQITDVAADEFRKVIRLNVTKRLLKIGTGLVVHIFFMGRPPRAHIFEEFLKNYGVISLKKTESNTNMFIATCDTFDNFDALIAVGSAVVDGTKINIKPRLPTGQKATRKDTQEKRKQLKARDDRSDYSLLQMPTGNNEESKTVIMKMENNKPNTAVIKVENNESKTAVSTKVENIQEDNGAENVDTNVYEDFSENQFDEFKNDDFENCVDDIDNIDVDDLEDY